MKLNELTKKELVELLNLIIKYKDNNFIKIDFVIESYLHKRFERLIKKLDKQIEEKEKKGQTLESLELEFKVCRLLNNYDYYHTLAELEEHKHKKEKSV